MSIYLVAPVSDLALAIRTGLPYAAGEAARRMIRDWAQSTGLELLQGYEDAKYPVTRWNTRGEPYHPAYSHGVHGLACRGACGGGCPPGMNAISLVPPDAVIIDCDVPGQCQIAHLALPPHFSTRGTGGCKHYFHHEGGLPRIIRASGRPVDILGNPGRQELWVKCWGPGYEVLTWHPDAAVLPASLLELYAAAVTHAEELRLHLGSVPVGRYLEEGIESGQQSHELWRSSCSLAACGHTELEVRGLLRQIADRCELTLGPWHDNQLASMARRAVEQFGRPAAPKPVLKLLRSPAAEGGAPACANAGRQAAPAATPPLTSDSHLSTVGPEKTKEDGRQVRIAAQGGCRRVRKALHRLLKLLRAVDPASLWPSRIDAATARKALFGYLLNLGIEQGSLVISWSAEKAAAAIGAGVSTVYRHLKALEHHAQLRQLGEGRISIAVSASALRPYRKRAGETITKAEALAVVRKCMQELVDKPRKISQRELLEYAEAQVWLSQERITSRGPRVTVHRIRQALQELQARGEFTKIIPARPEEISPGVWRSDPSIWAPGRIPVPAQPRKRRPFSSVKRAYLEMAHCSSCTPHDMQEAA